ncbi:recombinase family protein [Actinopolymorpha sp. B11F2]|uniref:recombinase family protein n=1 Tax=Actinopolymorpha sp. B11F2 TaxID=3160862 RepID=UPI0032E45A46
MVTTATAREYQRVSRDRSGHARSVDEQHEENARAATAQGWKLGTPYADPNVSASRYTKKARKHFDELLVDLQHGRFRAEVLILWESSRGSRRVGEWATLVDLLEDAGVKVFVTTHGRLYDPANSRDRRTLMEDAVDSEYESGKTSARTRRTQAALAAAGKPNGQVPYGYRRIYDPATRRFVRQEAEPAEAKVIATLYARLDAGHSLRSIAKGFEADGIRGRTGVVMSSKQLRSMALNERYVGVRTHLPVNAKPLTRSGATPAKATRSQAVWPPLVDRQTFDRVEARLTAPERRTSRPGRGVHLLSMLVSCDVCDGPLTARYREDRKGVRQYVCRNGGHVRIDADELDALVTKQVLGYLSRDDIAEKLRKSETTGPELDRVRDELAEARRALEEFYREVSAGRLSAQALAAVEPGMLARIAEAEARETELATPSGLAGILGTGNLRRTWKAMPMAAKREVVRTVLSEGHHGPLWVLRSEKPGHPVPVSLRVTAKRSEPAH